MNFAQDAVCKLDLSSTTPWLTSECSIWIPQTNGGRASLATVGSAPYRYLSSLTPGRDVLKNNADWLPRVTTFRARLLKTFKRVYRLVGCLVRACKNARILTQCHFKWMMFLHCHPQLNTVRHVTESKKNDRGPVAFWLDASFTGYHTRARA